MTVHLIAVQAKMGLEHYRSAGSFKAKVLELSRAAVEGLDDAPKLIAFPETIGFPLLLTLGSDLPPLKTVGEAVIFHARRNWRGLLELALRRGLVGLLALYHLRALPAYAAYHDAFREAARQTKATVVAGTTFLPHVEEEASRGVHIAGRRVYNTAYTFAPTGTVLNRSRKVYLTPGTESRSGLSRARLEELSAFDTPVGRLGVAICLDGFYSGVIDHLDGQGVQVVVQPSANHASWERRWPADSRLSEGEAWLQRGLRRQVQDRLHIRYGVNPMMVGDLWELRSRGRSSLVCNLRFWRSEVEGYPGILALARTSDQEEIVRACVDIGS